jgi:hypothetical protein
VTSLFRPELSRAFEDYFGRRGGETPNIPSEIVPVVIMDDNSKGPYVGCRHWMFGTNAGPSVGNLSIIGIENTDPIGAQLSAVVIDWIVAEVAGGVVADFLMGIVYMSQVVLADGAVRDIVTDKDLGMSTGDPSFGNVKGGTRAQAGQPVATVYPGNSIANGIPTRIEGPIILGPQQEFLIIPSIVNTGITAHFRGRYYPAI